MSCFEVGLAIVDDEKNPGGGQFGTLRGQVHSYKSLVFFDVRTEQ